MKRPRKRTIFILLIGGAVALMGGLRLSNRRATRPPVAIQQASGLPIEVATYNAHLLPSIAALFVGNRSDANFRAKAIAKQLRQFDIVGVCEAFDEQAASILIDEFNAIPLRPFSMVRSPEPQSFTQLTSGGLILFSRLPIIEQNTLVYSHGSRLFTTGFQSGDGLAAKGAVHARIRFRDSAFPGSQDARELDCFLTHLDSHSRSVRALQMAELTDFIALHHNPTNPILILGDFNIRAKTTDEPPRVNDSESEYQFLVKQLSMTSPSLKDSSIDNSGPSLGTSDTLSANGGERIDYIFLGQSVYSQSLKITQTDTLRLLDDQVPEGSLSDHAAIWCKIETGR